MDNECDRNPIEILPASKSPSAGSNEWVTIKGTDSDCDRKSRAIGIPQVYFG